MSTILKKFESSWEKTPAHRVDTVEACEKVCAELIRMGVSFLVKIVPARGRTHRRPEREPRQFVIVLLVEHGRG